LLWGYRIAPAIFVAAFLVNQITAPSLPTSVIIAFGNTLEAVVAGFLVGYWADSEDIFGTPNNVAKFFGICIFATAIDASVGVSGLTLTGLAETTDFLPIWFTWWMGDLAGAIVIAPSVVLWVRSESVSPIQLGEILVTSFGAAAVGLLCLSPLLPQTPIRDALAFLIILPLLWASLNQGPRETSTVALIISAFAIWGTISGAGPFAGDNMNESLIVLLVFLISVTIPSLALSAEVTTRDLINKLQKEHSLEAEVLWKASNQAASGGSLENLLAGCLEQICNVTNSDIGHVYIPDDIEEPHVLNPSSAWYFRRKKLAVLAQNTADIKMERGQGLPGRVWATGKPVWIPNIATASDFPRKQPLLREGIRSAFGFPIYAEGKLQAVVEFFASSPSSPDKKLLLTMQSIGEQLGRVLERQRAQEQQRALERALNSLMAAVYFTDTSGHVVYMNDAGRRLADARNAVRIENATLVPVDRATRRKFSELLQRTTVSGEGHARKGVTISLPDTRSKGLVATMVPLTKSELSDLCGAASASTAVFVQDPEKVTNFAAKAIADLYGLTHSELGVLQNLTASRSVKQLSKLVGVSESTTKTHLQHIFAKTGTHKQSELIELLVSSTPPVSLD